MNTQKLEKELRDMARQIDEEKPFPEVDMKDLAELLRVLARMVTGRSAASAFGAPGDWGYGTPIGDALAAQPDSANKGSSGPTAAGGYADSAGSALSQPASKIST